MERVPTLYWTQSQKLQRCKESQLFAGFKFLCCCLRSNYSLSFTWFETTCLSHIVKKKTKEKSIDKEKIGNDENLTWFGVNGRSHAVTSSSIFSTFLSLTLERVEVIPVFLSTSKRFSIFSTTGLRSPLQRQCVLRGRKRDRGFSRMCERRGGRTLKPKKKKKHHNYLIFFRFVGWHLLQFLHINGVDVAVCERPDMNHTLAFRWLINRCVIFVIFAIA